MDYCVDGVIAIQVDPFLRPFVFPKWPKAWMEGHARLMFKNCSSIFFSVDAIFYFGLFLIAHDGTYDVFTPPPLLCTHTHS